ncbi:MAG: TfoX/Sxy family protein [Brevirhabdus sp.]
MAFDEGLAELMREDLGDQPGLSEKKMFGGLAFLIDGNMLCGVHKGGAMYRVGKDHQSEAEKLEGVGPMEFTGRPMGGMVDADEDAMANDTTRATLLHLSLSFVTALPPK